MYKSTIDYIKLDVPAGGESQLSISHAAALMCIKHRCTVRFVINDVLLEIHYSDILNSIRPLTRS